MGASKIEQGHRRVLGRVAKHHVVEVERGQAAPVDDDVAPMEVAVDEPSGLAGELVVHGLGATDMLLARRIYRDWSYVEGIAYLCRR